MTTRVPATERDGRSRLVSADRRVCHLAAIGIDLGAVRARIESSVGPEALAQVVHREPRPSGLKGGASTLALLQRAHPGIFEDALSAVINEAKERKS